jgi:hypothetical protein
MLVDRHYTSSPHHGLVRTLDVLAGSLSFPTPGRAVYTRRLSDGEVTLRFTSPCLRLYAVLRYAYGTGFSRYDEVEMIRRGERRHRHLLDVIYLVVR